MQVALWLVRVAVAHAEMGEPLELKATVSPDAISFGLKPVADVSVAVKVKVGDALTVIVVVGEMVSTGVTGVMVSVAEFVEEAVL